MYFRKYLEISEKQKFVKTVFWVMDKTLTPSPWTTLMDYPKMDYP